MSIGFQLRLAMIGNLKEFSRGVHLRFAAGARDAAETMAARAKTLLRNDTRQALGDKVANAWRIQIFPQSAAVHTHKPTVRMYTKAPLIVAAFSDAITISAKNARYLAIPTENVPRKGRKRMTPEDVENRFNQDFIFFHGRGRQLLAFVDVLRAKSGKGFRRKTKGRAGRSSELVLMFVMVPQVHTKKLLRTRELFAQFQEDWPALFAEKVSARVNAAGSNI